MITLFFSVNILQIMAGGFDELYFHQQRHIPKWERIGHPLDTLSSIAVFVALALLNPAHGTPIGLVALILFSCLFVTKDEWVHQKYCSGGELWLHSFQFLIHPFVFFLAWKVWSQSGFTLVHEFQLTILASFLLYQIVYWNFYKSIQEDGITLPEVNNGFYDGLGGNWYESEDGPVALLRAEAKLKNPWVEGIIHEVITHKKNEEINILDIGCGAGLLTNALAKNGFKVNGLDLSEPSLEIAKKFDSTGCVNYQAGTAYQLPFPDQAFEVVTCMDFLEHVDDPQMVVEEAARVLKPNGLFIFHTFNRNWFSYLVIIKGVEWFVKNTPKHLHVLHLFIKPKELEKYCTKARLSDAHFIGIAPKIWNKAFWKLIRSGLVDPSFTFQFRKSLSMGYLGFAKKE